MAPAYPSEGRPASGFRPLGGRTQRTRVTNGTATIPGVDGRTLWARRLRDLLAIYASDLGGAENMTEAEKSLVRRAATLSVELELLEQRFAASGKGASAPDLDLYGRMTNTLRRLLECTGLERRARDVTPSLAQYLDLTRGADDR
ncbi:hypothetical protein [Methylopila sp. 73B]|uniref:hypothetical protein n=1 Tax=Methylopila sp. 73B TaxID=1120792 RepID=UPI00037B075A|nr:hypothetical protein [Methylopila sp. 73B]